MGLWCPAGPVCECPCATRHRRPRKAAANADGTGADAPLPDGGRRVQCLWWRVPWRWRLSVRAARGTGARARDGRTSMEQLWTACVCAFAAPSIDLTCFHLGVVLLCFHFFFPFFQLPQIVAWVFLCPTCLHTLHTSQLCIEDRW